MKKLWYVILALACFSLDFLLKQFVIDHSSELMSGELCYHVTLLPFLTFDLAYVENTGIAWGLFSSFQSWILILRIGVIGAIVLGLCRSKKMQRFFFPYLLIIFGAFANVLDTFLYGHVVDMFHFLLWGRSYGIFNLAVLMIFLGAISILFSKEGAHVSKQ
jgi:lipoprotein signal peptidase